MSKFTKLIKTSTFWAGLAVIMTALGTYFADNDPSGALQQGAKGAVNIVLALLGAGIITQRNAIAKLAKQVEDLSRQLREEKTNET